MCLPIPIAHYRGSGDLDHLGHGEREHSGHPQLVESLVGEKVVSIAVGSHHSLTLTASGDVYGWGRDCSGEQEETLPQPTLIPEASKQGIVYLSCGAYEVCWRGEGGEGDEGGRREEGEEGGRRGRREEGEEGGRREEGEEGSRGGRRWRREGEDGGEK